MKRLSVLMLGFWLEDINRFRLKAYYRKCQANSLFTQPPQLRLLAYGSVLFEKLRIDLV